MVFDEMAVPEFEHQQRPNFLGPVRTPLFMFFDQPGRFARST
jgi:hypothetical protein